MRGIIYSPDGMRVIECGGRCNCHTCCIPYDGENGVHCDDCEPDEVDESDGGGQGT